jgi:hypothetical protein
LWQHRSLEKTTVNLAKTASGAKTGDLAMVMDYNLPKQQ